MKEPLSALERHCPAVAARLCETWTTAAARALLRELVGDAPPRAGAHRPRPLPPDVLDELLFLLTVHEQRIPCIGTLELDFPHVVERLVRLWGRSPYSCRKYLESLVVIVPDPEKPSSERLSRRGFPPGAFSDLLFLLRVHDLAYPEGRHLSHGAASGGLIAVR